MIKNIKKNIDNSIKEKKYNKKNIYKILNIKSKKNFNLKSKLDNFQSKQFYIYQDFTPYNNEDFIKIIYMGFLKRKPSDSELKHQLHYLYTGKKTKPEIITSIYYSKESRTIGTTLKGSKKRYISYKLSQLPFIGNIYKSIFFILNINKKMQSLHQLEATTNQQLKLLEEKSEKDLLALYDFTQSKTHKIYNSLSLEIKESINDYKHKLQKNINDTNNSINTAKYEFCAKIDNSILQVKDYCNQEVENLNNQFSTKLNQYKQQIQNIPPTASYQTDNFLKKSLKLTKHKNITNSSKLDSSLYYSLFEDAFYESKHVKEKQKIYIEYINKNKLHLDIGCGRGEFLELLQENKIPAIGIDINAIEINRLKNLNFNVECIDIQKYYQTSRKNYFSSVSALQVAEHLSINEIKKLLKNTYDSLQVGGTFILETVNPHSYFAFGGFFMDETHIRPIPPEQLTFLMQWYGFTDIEIVYSSRLPKEFWVTDNKRNYYDYALIGYRK